MSRESCKRTSGIQNFFLVRLLRCAPVDNSESLANSFASPTNNIFAKSGRSLFTGVMVVGRVGLEPTTTRL